MDVRTADGSVVKISAGNEQDLAKTLGVEMVQNMYKVRDIVKTIVIIIKMLRMLHCSHVCSLLLGRLMLKILTNSWRIMRFLESCRVRLQLERL